MKRSLLNLKMIKNEVREKIVEERKIRKTRRLIVQGEVGADPVGKGRGKKEVRVGLTERGISLLEMTVTGETRTKNQEKMSILVEIQV